MRLDIYDNPQQALGFLVLDAVEFDFLHVIFKELRPGFHCGCLGVHV